MTRRTHERYVLEGPRSFRLWVANLLLRFAYRVDPDAAHDEFRKEFKEEIRRARGNRW